MNNLLKLLFVSFVFGLVSSEVPDATPEVKEENGVLILTNDNFDSVVTETKHVLVEFYAPWCGHCKALAPEYAKAAAQLKEEGSEVKLGMVDATVETELGTKFKVQGYPTLKFFKNGSPLEYGGGRQAADIVSWLKKKTGPPTVPLENAEAVANFKKDNEVVVIGYFPDSESDGHLSFKKVADEIDDVMFGSIHTAEAAAESDIAENTVTVFKQFDEGRADYDGAVTDGDLLNKFVKENQLRLVTEFTSESAPKIFGGDIQIHNLLFIPKLSQESQDHLTAFTEAAKQFKGKVLFIYIDTDSEENKRVMEFFGLTDADIPDYRIIKMSENMAKFKPDTKELTTEAIAAFTNKVVTGEVQRHLMSAEIPDDWDKNPVTVLVGKNFEQVAYDKKKKVFVEFYAPWCGHCKSLAPTWDKLGEKYSDNADVVIAKMDSTANELSQFEISGFPTLKFFPEVAEGEEQKVLDYDGDRTVEAMAAFIDSNGEKGNVATKPLPPKETEPPADFNPNQIKDDMHKELEDVVPKGDPKEMLEKQAEKEKQEKQKTAEPKEGEKRVPQPEPKKGKEKKEL
uniref:protein disulfide-isomerase 2 isoform X5 n=1 Tax=Ciona intestinalis TaxID=7719 RepID=UPI000180B87E|nr:protein disulfide-isomerase 2 isoform X5 [Ciona intestinalis]XP_009860659.1 protein disulfide-isomerase 2 isoform X4 [Ciona intestinalis]|eukprot:XP_002129037.1 protein disulfide-isomerase 2 isoform X5 [Ciona intestinalis]